MEYRFLGRTGVRVSQLVFGTMSFGGDADEATSAALFGRARDAGINCFDCADVYAKGRSEEILGALIAGCRDELVISTKAYFPTGSGENARGSSRYHLVRAVEASLKRLATDRIDIFYLHRFDDMTALDETLAALETLIQQGKILYPAVSNFSAWQTAKTLAVAGLRGLSPIVASQPMYNLLKRQAEVEILPHALSEGLGVLTYSPLAGGLLSGKYGVGKAPAHGRVVDNAMYKTRYGAASNFEIAEAFTALARELGHHPATLAIAWVAAQPGVTAPLIGARSLEQLEPCLAAANLSLDPETLAKIGALSPEPPPATDRNEEKSAHNYGSR
ncbi:MAG: aldo/keto reductase [Polyangiaceae bacterium]|nr:aldo/keto reductase [Polyangiaceae bacterium]